MKLETSNAVVETKKVTQVEKFEIVDPQLFISMYRNTIYKNKIRVIPQEYMCNARDAHREKGITDTPIQVTLPNTLEPVLRIRDFGPGINNERMSIFRSYGGSTKRNSNNETGGFGIGCKCAWSYTEAFTVDTVYEENGERIHKVYSIYVSDETDPGSVRTISENVVELEKYDDFPIGTEVAIPVKNFDIDNFVESVKTVGTYWDVRPTIVNDDEFEWHDITVTTEKDNWKLCGHSKLYSIKSKSYIVIDSIAYNIDFDLLRQGKSVYEESDDGVNEVLYNIDSDTHSFYNHSGVVFFFNTGDLKISPNREDLQYDEDNVKKLVDYLTKAREDVVTLFKEQVVSDPNATLLEILAHAASLNLFNIKVMWKDPTRTDGEEVNITSLVKKVNNLHCYFHSDGSSEHIKGMPHDQMTDKTAIYWYNTEHSAGLAADRLDDYPEILEDIDADNVLIFYGTPKGRWGSEDRDVKYYKSFVNRKMGTIKTPAKYRKSSFSSNATGIFEISSGDYKLMDSDQIDKEQANKLDFKKTLFIRRKGREHHIFAGDKQRSFHKAFLKIHGTDNVYVLNGKGERALKKLGIKIRWIEDQDVTAKLTSFFNRKDVKNREFDNCYCLERIIEAGLKSQIYWFLRNDKPAHEAWDKYCKFRNIRLDHSKVNAYTILANIYDIPHEVAKHGDVVRVVQNALPFYDLIDRGLHGNKKIWTSIIRSYKEYDDGKAS